MMLKTAYLFGIRYSVGNMGEACREVLRSVRDLKGRYICFSNVHTLVTAVENEKYRKILNRSAYTFPDGAPVAWKLRMDGNVTAERIAGPDFMDAMFDVTSDGSVSHFFYGSSPETLERLAGRIKARYPQIKIAGKYAPPFRKLSAKEDEDITALINGSDADIVWVGLGAPKQEVFMHSHRNKIKSLMIGVGAGFDFHAETAKRAPLWMQKLYLEWLYRLCTEPKRLAGRYFKTNTKFILYCLTKRG